LEILRQTAFELLADPGRDAKETERILNLLLRSREQDQAGRKLAIVEKKAARLDALEAKAREISKGGGLSAETLEVIEKQLKLL
jgi:hypothetical protein